jgi:hypothetical protein
MLTLHGPVGPLGSREARVMAAAGRLRSRRDGSMIFVLVSTFAATVSAVAAVLAAIPSFVEYVRDCRLRRGRHRRLAPATARPRPDQRRPARRLDFPVAAWRAFVGGVRDGESGDFGSADWSKSSHSFSNGACVEMAGVPVSCFNATI